MEVECLALKDLTTPRKSFPLEAEEDDAGQGEQKENICAGRRRSTPLKSPESGVPVAPMGRKAGSPELAHVTPIKHAALAEPWTPTANLKMLISAASLHIRNREMKKVLFRPIENERDQSAGGEDPAVEDVEVGDCQFEALEEEDDAEKKPSRKQKSLGLLCKKFLALYPDYPPAQSPIWISLDEVATSLGVERRRIYDIVNVLESLMIVGRMAKNSYTWYGRLRLEETLEELQRRGRQQGYHLQMELTGEAREAGPGCEDDGAEGDGGHAAGNRKDKSLRIMSQKFVMLFLVSRTQTVTLDAAAKVLIEESQDSSSHSKYKTKVRRLYDIANVLTSLGLIKKVHVREERGRKPAFRWLGPVEFSKTRSSGNAVNAAAVAPPEATRPAAGQATRKPTLARHASFSVTPTLVAVQRQVSSAPSSPHREPPGQTNQPVDYSRKAASGGAAGQLWVGNPARNRPPGSGGGPPPSSTLLAPAVPPESVFTPSSSLPCLAYLPGLSQPSVVMLYRAPDGPGQLADGQRSPGAGSEDGRKRKREEWEEEEEEVEVAAKKKGTLVLEECDETRAEPQREAAAAARSALPREPLDESGVGGVSGEPARPSHYLYVPNSAGLNSLNFLLAAGQPPPPLALPRGGVPALALPYVLLPPAALSHYPLVAAGGLQQQGPEGKLSFSLPAVMSPAHLMVGAAQYGLAAAPEARGSPAPSPSTPEPGRLHGSAAGTPRSPPGPRQTAGVATPEPLTPHTPKDVPVAASKAFFQTPGTLGGVGGGGTEPANRRRGSAQRRLDVGRPANS